MIGVETEYKDCRGKELQGRRQIILISAPKVKPFPQIDAYFRFVIQAVIAFCPSIPPITQVYGGLLNGKVYMRKISKKEVKTFSVSEISLHISLLRTILDVRSFGNSVYAANESHL